LPADVVELTSLVELVRKGDRVDRLALGPEPECGAIDLRVALAVEVRGVEDLADRPDRGRRQEHRAENRLLGLEVLRRDDGAQAVRSPSRRGRGHRCGSQAVEHGLVQTEESSVPLQGERNICSEVIPSAGRPVDRPAGVVQPETSASSGKFRRRSTCL